MSTVRVVVPVDGSPRSETAVPIGVALASRLKAGLDLLVVRPSQDEELARAYLEKVSVPPGAVEVRRRVEDNRVPADAILAHASKPDVLVCMATHGHTGVGEAVCGSTAEAVLRDATRPIVLVGPHARPELAWREPPTILVCVGSSPDESGIPALADFATSLDATVRLVTVVIVGDGLERDPVVDPDRVAALERLVGAFERRGVPASYEILPGHDLWPPINAAADAVPAALVAVASESRAGLARILLGSDAMTVVRHSRQPVVALHPAGPPAA
jgi:nucleotide-binding universal stress UspA family protein